MDPNHNHPISPLAVTVTLAVMLTALVSSASAASPLPPYTNHTVGGPTGWFFDAKKNSSATDYSKWARSQSFYLGDFLIFKTNSNMSVIETNNETTYRRCDASEDGGDGTFVYSAAGGAQKFGVAAVVAVPLKEDGAIYFFSDAEDGIQCAKGMRFEIAVEKGRGLPPALNQPPPPPMSDVQVPPPPETEIAVNGGGPQGESFYTGGAGKGFAGGARGWEIWVFVLFWAVLICFY